MLQTTFLACQLVRRVNLAPLLVEMLVCLNKVKSHDLCCVQLVRTLSSPSNIVLCRLISSANYMCKPISWPAQELFESCNFIPVQLLHHMIVLYYFIICTVWLKLMNHRNSYALLPTSLCFNSFSLHFLGVFTPPSLTSPSPPHLPFFPLLGDLPGGGGVFLLP